MATHIHIISPLQQLTVAGAASRHGHALEVGVHWKLASHLSECSSTGVDFIPLVAETLGGLAKGTISTVRVIGKFLGHRVSPSDPSTSTKHLFGRLAIALWQGNACLWLHHYPSVPPSNLTSFFVLFLIIIVLRCNVFFSFILLLCV